MEGMVRMEEPTSGFGRVREYAAGLAEPTGLEPLTASLPAGGTGLKHLGPRGLNAQRPKSLKATLPPSLRPTYLIYNMV